MVFAVLNALQPHQGALILLVFDFPVKDTQLLLRTLRLVRTESFKVQVSAIQGVAHLGRQESWDSNIDGENAQGKE